MGKRKQLSVRTRFEVFKRDKFTCRYCGKKSPDVALEIDHIIPVAENGTNDEMNLVTSCFECNSGKSDKPLSQMVTGEDPHDKAIELLERERQLSEYEEVRKRQHEKYSADVEWAENNFTLSKDMKKLVRAYLREFSIFDINDALHMSIEKTDGRHPNCERYFCGIIRTWREHGGRENADRAEEERRKYTNG